MKAATNQPDPKPGKHNVLKHVLADIQARSDMGKKKYGTRLKTHNGRDALWDAYQELLDLVMYLRQALLEQPGSTEPAAHADALIKCEDCSVYQKGEFMDADFYQRLAGRTLLEKPDFAISPEQVMITWNAIGLAGEAGEVAELVKKGIFHQQGLDLEKLEKELGDVLWYVAAICTHTGLTLREVMTENIEKLIARYPDCYSPERSTHRESRPQNGLKKAAK